MMVQAAAAPRGTGPQGHGAGLRAGPVSAPERPPGAPSTCAMLWPSLQPLLAPRRQRAPSPRHMLETALHCLLRLLETVFYVS